MTVKVAIVGASFARQAMLPAFRTIPDVEVVAIASARLASAQSAAADFGVPNAYDDWQAMIASHPVDLVCVVTPTVYHAPITLAALDAGANVLCEKPTAMNAAEARTMLYRAEGLHRIHMIDHELRFNPTRRKLKALIDSGYIGKVRHIQIVNISPGNGDPASRVKTDWLSDAAMGGGRLGANGSHQLDLLRWWLGDIGAITGHVATMVAQRTDKNTGEPWTATADDEVSFFAEMKNGALATVVLSGAARHGAGNYVQIFGSEGTILLSNDDEKLRVARAGEDFQDMSQTDPNASLPGIGKGIWNVSFVALANELIGAIRERRPLREGATFADGLKTQEAIDAVKQSWAERRWINL